ncbi:MAG: hypothetical protein Q4E38_09815 [Eubacteriales bacterium]|nr:hypothetical protein [Eubacteriales bacterium]
MKEMRVYVKPMMESVAVQSNKAVADQCWGESGNVTHYYDSTGHGFVKFTVNAPNCKHWDGSAEENATYTCQLNEQGIPCDQMTPEAAQAAISEFAVAFRTRFEEIANGGSSYKGFSDDFPPDPHGMS